MKNGSDALLRPLPFIALACGIFAGVLRWWQLSAGFDSLGLPVDNSDTGLLLLFIALLTLFAALCVFAWLRRETPIAGPIAAPSPAAPLFSTLAAAAGLASAAITLCSAFRVTSVWDMIGGLLLAVSAALTVPVMRHLTAGEDSPVRTASLVTVIWACFRLIEVYRNVSANPSVSYYFYDLISLIVLILLTFFCSGYLFGRASAARLYLICIAYFCFGVMTLVSDVLRCCTGTFSWTLCADALVFVFGLFFALALFTSLNRRPRKDLIGELHRLVGDEAE